MKDVNITNLQKDIPSQHALVDIFEAVAIVKFKTPPAGLEAKVQELMDVFGKNWVYYDDIISFRGN